MDRNFYFQNGYYIGNLSEIFNDKVIIENYFDNVRRSFAELDPKKWIYNHSVLTRPPIPANISIDQIENRKNLVEQRNLNVTQQLYISYVEPEMARYFRDNINNFISPLYPLDKKSVYHHDHKINALTAGDFITEHQDGDTQDRLCGIIIYFSEQEEYEKKQGGGELVLNTDIIVPPIKGTFVLLDYTKHNVKHGVNRVCNDFTRYTYVSFISRLANN